MHTQIAFVKTGWSNYYAGGSVEGKHAHVQKFHDGHERFNFRQHRDGLYYGYLPPIGGKRTTPKPEEKKGWLLIFVSAKNGKGPLTVVGWYEDAMLHDEYPSRPEYSDSNDFELDVEGNEYTYCISAPKANLIPTAHRTETIPGNHFGRTPLVYVRGNGKNDKWRQKLARFADSLVSDKAASHTATPPQLSFPDSKKRKRVEEAAINTAKDLLIKKNYRVTDKQKENCGYDLLARHRKTKEELHVEVKGTSGETMHFYMTRNEYGYMRDPRWRLIMVCDALEAAKAKILTEVEVGNMFNLEPFNWEATINKK